MLVFLFLVFSIPSTKSVRTLDLSDIKKQQTTPSGAAVTIATTTTGPCNVGCPDQWIPYGGNCYLKVLDILTQKTAEEECVSLGAHLASFETAAEATAVKTLVLETLLFSDTADLLSYSSSDDAWIGLAKKANAAWTWTDGSSVEFTNLPDGTTISGASCVSVSWNIQMS